MREEEGGTWRGWERDLVPRSTGVLHKRADIFTYMCWYGTGAAGAVREYKKRGARVSLACTGGLRNVPAGTR